MNKLKRPLIWTIKGKGTRMIITPNDVKDSEIDSILKDGEYVDECYTCYYYGHGGEDLEIWI